MIVATAGVPELHSTERVISWWLLSLKVPVAVNCSVVPMAVLGLAGVTAIALSVAEVTVSIAVPVTEPDFALIVTVPAAIPVANPVESTTAVFVSEDDQAAAVSTCVLPSSKEPLAVNCCLVPFAIVAGEGVTAIEIRWAATTVRVVLSVNEPNVAVMVV